MLVAIVMVTVRPNNTYYESHTPTGAAPALEPVVEVSEYGGHGETGVDMDIAITGYYCFMAGC